jgi:hypothetical protein
VLSQKGQTSASVAQWLDGGDGVNADASSRPTSGVL